MQFKNINSGSDKPLINKLLDNAGIQKDMPKKKWEDLDAIYWTIAESLMNLGENINACIRQININKVTNIDDLTVTVDGLKRDIEDLTQTLLSIRQRYQGRTGVITNENDNLLCIDCFTDYQSLAERQRVLIIQPLMTITEVLAECMERPAAKPAEPEVKFTAGGDIIGEVVKVDE